MPPQVASTWPPAGAAVSVNVVVGSALVIEIAQKPSLDIAGSVAKPSAVVLVVYPLLTVKNFSCAVAMRSSVAWASARLVPRAYCW